MRAHMIQDFAFVAFVDNAAGEAAALAKQFGFSKHGTYLNADHYQAGKAHWLIHPARNAAERLLLDTRGPAPYAIGFIHDDADRADTFLRLPVSAHLATLSLDAHLHMHHTTAVPTIPCEKALYSGIDHCAIACPQSTFLKSIEQLAAWDFNPTYRLDVAQGDSGMRSVALGNPNGKVRLPMIAPDGETSQVQVYLDHAKGMGIQHVGLATENIIDTVRTLQNEGVRFLTINPEYYDSDAFQTMPFSDTQKAACRALNILADANSDGGYLLQIFTEPCLGQMMIEIIERHDHNTFGAQNIKSLFKSVATHHQEAGLA